MKRLNHALLFTSPLTLLALAPSAGAQAICLPFIRDVTSGNCLQADTTPTLGRLYPLSTSLNVSAAGDVGMGTTTPGGKLHVRETGADIGIYADKTSANSPAPAVRAESDSDDSFSFAMHGVLTPAAGGANASAVRAENLSTGTTSVGTWGSTAGGGWGVFGYTPSGNGIEGRTTSGIGVLASRFSLDGTTAALHATSSSDDIGANTVYAVLPNPNFDGRAVYGYVPGAATAGIGVQGHHLANGWGVYGRIDGTGAGGVGVRGYAPAGSGFAIYAAGAFGASGTKSFVQPHPGDPSKELRFVCLEGNESGTYFRGSSAIDGGLAIIDVPEDFRLVSEEDGLTVQVTARGPAMLWVEEQGLDRIVVRGSADVDFAYMVNGVRRGFADHQVAHENAAFRPQFRDEPFGAELPPAVRQLLVDNGTLNPDFTPNEHTAARMGWTLVDRPVASPKLPAPVGDVSLPQGN